VVSVQHVSKSYLQPRNRFDRLSAFLGNRQGGNQEFIALNDVSFEVRRKECFAVVGPNGSGKSTLLQLICGISLPTRGRVAVSGRIGALLELGAGFNPEFTGRENVIFNNSLTGSPERILRDSLQSIQEFAGIGHFFDRPVKEYSTGMYVRLAFANAVQRNPEVLIVDEALAVGDARFAAQCVRRMDEMKSAGTSILFVTHDLGLMKRLADRAVYLVNGRIQFAGTPAQVAEEYIAAANLSTQSFPDQHEANHIQEPAEASIHAIRFNGSLRSSGHLLKSGDNISLVIEFLLHSEVSDLMVGMLIQTATGIDVGGTNSKVEAIAPFQGATGARGRCEFRFPANLSRGRYTLTVALQHADGSAIDWHHDALEFEVIGSRDIAGVVDLHPECTMEKA
jgi:lipopolysaccharide transport system ATP-binding protein